MSRFNRYYRDWKAKHRTGNFVRYRWRITPAYTSPLSYNTPPAWGAAATVGYKKVPGRCFYAAGDIEMAFDKRGHGTPDAENYTQTVNLAPLLGSSDPDLVDLGHYILDPSFGGVAYPMGSPGIGATFQTSLTWELFTDDGDGSLGIGSFRCMYIGAMRVNTEKELTLKLTNELVMKYEFDLVHLAKHCLETVIADHVSTFFFARYNATDYEPTNASGSSGVFYVDLWRDGTTNYARCLSRKARSGEPYDKARYWPITRLFTTMRILTDAVFCAFLRVTFVEATPRFRYQTVVLPGSPSFNLNDGNPYDFLQFFQQSHNKSGVRSSTIIGRDALCFQAAIWESSIGGVDQTFNAAYTASPQRFTGGFLSPHGDKNSLYAKEIANLWDFFKRCARGLCRGTFRYTATGIDFEFYGMNDGADARIDTTDIQRLPTAGVVPKLESRTVTGATIAIEGGSGEDRTSAEYKTGTLAEDEEQCTLVFHNLPSVGEAANRFQFTAAVPNPDLIGPAMGGSSTGYDSLCLCYFDTPSGISSNRIPIRPADEVRIITDTGIVGYIDGVVTSRPAPAIADANQPIFFDQLFWYPVLASLKNAQRYSCLAYSMAKRLSVLYGNRKQWLLEEPIRYSTLAPLAIGDRLRLDDTSVTGLNIFLNGPTYFTGYPDRAVLVRAKISLSTGVTETELLANG